KRARNESNDSVTLTPKIKLLRWKNHGDASSSLAVGSPPPTFDVECQRKSHHLLVIHRAKDIHMVAASFLPPFHVKLSHLEQRNFWYEYDSVVRCCKQLASPRTILDAIGKDQCGKASRSKTFMYIGDNKDGNATTADNSSERTE